MRVMHHFCGVNVYLLVKCALESLQCAVSEKSAAEEVMPSIGPITCGAGSVISFTFYVFFFLFIALQLRVNVDECDGPRIFLLHMAVRKGILWRNNSPTRSACEIRRQARVRVCARKHIRKRHESSNELYKAYSVQDSAKYEKKSKRRAFCARIGCVLEIYGSAAAYSSLNSNSCRRANMLELHRSAFYRAIRYGGTRAVNYFASKT
eukprot:IDg17790t1